MTEEQKKLLQKLKESKKIMQDIFNKQGKEYKSLPNKAKIKK